MAAAFPRQELVKVEVDPSKVKSQQREGCHDATLSHVTICTRAETLTVATLGRASDLQDVLDGPDRLSLARLLHLSSVLNPSTDYHYDSPLLSDGGGLYSSSYINCIIDPTHVKGPPTSCCAGSRPCGPDSWQRALDLSSSGITSLPWLWDELRRLQEPSMSAPSASAPSPAWLRKRSGYRCMAPRSVPVEWDMRTTSSKVRRVTASYLCLLSSCSCIGSLGACLSCPKR